MKKKILICALIILGVFILGISAGAAILSYEGLGISTGRCLITDNGSLMLISHNSPVKLNSPDYDDDFQQSFTDGDELLVFHSVINESYPASTFAYYIIKTADGTYEDLPSEVLTQLTELGWINTEEGNTKLSENISIQKESCNLSIDIPEGWTYKETTDINNKTGFSVDIYKESSPANLITISCQEMFAVCGTGLMTQDVTIGEYKAHKGIYDDNPAWDYIVFNDMPGYYVILNSISADLWNEYASDINGMLSSIKIAQNIISYEKALSLAKESCDGEYKKVPGEFSLEDGIWSFKFEKNGTSQIISIDSEGNIV